ncbi:ABC transporter substrate-binding protein [Rathayibacter sp. VKM Ac-2857]|uniref:ABC transporter substrate-binding protein n=1 Tax=Rathayibacter sp. VKM Ac-2857 TaxID=2739020 RepID=UPI0015657E2E|nr:extracellular solute-binding protein [Rathayibacter sp. VKM Ac-2857]NQX16718.1 extracellular solute-binding protein [Rathayibacter sp. VKM Ac-2857]
MTHRSRTRTRLRTALLGGVALALVLSGCSAAGGDGRTTLTFMTWDSPEVMEPVVAAFEEANPDIRVEVSHAPPVAEYISTLQNRLLAGTAADVFVMGSENKTNLIDGELVVDITDEPYMDVIAPLNKEIRGRDGRTYGLSISSWSTGLAYDADLVASLGYDEFPTEWDDFVQLLRDLKETGTTPYLEPWSALPDSIASSVGAANARNGVSDLDAFDGGGSFEENWAEPLGQWAELFDEGLISQDVVGVNGDQVLEEFVTGRAAMIPMGPWNVTKVPELNPDLNWAIAGFPQPDGEPWFSGNASPGWVINAKAKQPEAAQAFLGFLASPEGVAAFQKATNSMTTTTNYEPAIDEHLAPNLLALQEDRVYLPQAAWPRYQDALNVEMVAQLQLMAQGQLTPAEVGAALDAKVAQLGG